MRWLVIVVLIQVGWPFRCNTWRYTSKLVRGSEKWGLATSRLEAQTDAPEAALMAFNASQYVHTTESISDVGIDTNSSIDSSGSPRGHTQEAKDKISAANKGKKPWNAGVKHSDDTKRKIAVKTREAMHRRKLAKAAEMGLTLDEFEANKMEERKAKAAARRKGGLTPEGRKRISDSLKARWADPEYRKSYTEAMVGKRAHSEETKRRISEAIKEKWKDNEYRDKISKPPSDETRARISATLKSRWEDPNFREHMMKNSFARTDEWRQAISRGVKAKWQDPTYQVKIRESIQNNMRPSPSSSSTKTSSTSRHSATAGTRKRAPRKPKPGTRKLNKAEAKERRVQQKQEMALKEAKREETLQKAIKASKKGNASLKELLGGEAWFEEKLRRTREGDPFIDDDSLARQLSEEWGEMGDGFCSDSSGGNSGSGTRMGEDEDRANDEGALGEWDMYEDDGTVEDVIEVYDENGKLVGSFTAREYERLRSKR